ncbi:MAG: glutamate-1-semialdehyde 2,1-aminomutase [Candidatus Omnitrophica bacterium]|nr:glutamate-1-semialdehyde 2,1-aminomutase [Candidatus Omnitrophota bacterium]
MTNDQLWQRAIQKIPGGVNSPVRSFKAVGGTPIFFKRGKGAYLESVDGKRYIDYCMSWGALILGHADPKVVSAVQKACSNGTSYGACTPLEVELAEKITRQFPSIEKVRLVNSGTEAVMSALRVARGFTKRPGILKFNGCYHGHSDSLLVKAGSGVMSFGISSSAGVPAEFTAKTFSVPYNDIDAVRQVLKDHGKEIAAVIVEPVAGNMGVVLPKKNFLADLRELTEKIGTVLIFDEVITGFRVSDGGAQKVYGIKPDLTTLGKIVGGGFPLAAFGGRKELMDLLAPEGSVYQAGTLSGNPVACTAGLATLAQLNTQLYKTLERNTDSLAKAIKETAGQSGIALDTPHIGSMLGLSFKDPKQYNRLFHLFLNEGIYLPPSAYETVFVSRAHSRKVIDKTIAVFQKAFQRL